MKLNCSLITPAIIILIIAFIIISGCKGSKELKIFGDWEKVTFTDDEITVIWSFYDGGKLYISNLDSVIDSADYAISSKVVEYFVDIKGLCHPDSASTNIEFEYSTCDDGRYKIDELSNEFLKLLRLSNGDGSSDAAFKYYEFTKANKIN